jgi:hypothetical protein
MANRSILYKHEYGTDANGLPLQFILTGPKFYNGKENYNLTGIIPDSNQTGNLSFIADGYRYPQSANTIFSITQNITPTTDYIQCGGSARYYQYTWSGSQLGQDWQLGQWFDDVQVGSTF